MNKVYILKKLKEIKTYEEKINHRIKNLNATIEKRTIKFKLMNFKPSGRIIDLGTGVGPDLISLSKLSEDDIELIGIDLTFKQLKIAEEITSKINKIFHFVRADILHPPFRDNAFNAANINNVLHDHPLNILEKIISEVSRICRKDSILLISEPSNPYEKHQVLLEVNKMWSGIEDLKKLLTILNLKPLEKIKYDLSIFNYYGSIYPSILKKLLEKNNFKIIKSIFISEDMQVNSILEKLEEKIKLLNLNNEAKKYLIERLKELKKKTSIIGNPQYHQLIIKAIKNN